MCKQIYFSLSSSGMYARCLFVFVLFFFLTLAPGIFQCDFENVIFNLALLIGIFKSSNDNVLRWMPPNHAEDKSTLVQEMAWCRQATSHYLNQCWPRSPTPYGVTRPHWVKPFSQLPSHPFMQIRMTVHSWFIMDHIIAFYDVVAQVKAISR